MKSKTRRYNNNSNCRFRFRLANRQSSDQRNWRDSGRFGEGVFPRSEHQSGVPGSEDEHCETSMFNLL